MFRAILLIFLSICSIQASAYDDDEEDINRMKKYPGGRCYMMRLTLADKYGTSGMITNPQAYLSEQAIDRRRRQGIAIDSTDLPVSRIYLDRLQSEGVEIICCSRWNNSVVIKDKSLQHLKQLSKLPFVTSSRIVWRSPDSIRVHANQRIAYKSDIRVWDKEGNTEYGATNEQSQLLGLNSIHALGMRGKGIRIAILDGGFMNVDKIKAFSSTHIEGTADLVYPKAKNVYSTADHGTKVLSTMAVNIPGIYVGSAPEASYWLMRCEDTESEQMVEEDYWVAAAEMADSIGCQVITTSLGYHGYDHKDMNYRYRDLDGHSSMISNIASMLAGKGIVLVCSAGNDGMGSWKKVNVPADAEHIISVGAVTPDGVNAAFSSIGPTADGRIKPEVMACGSPAAVINGRGSLHKDIGTSFAAPQVAGLVACYWQMHPDLKATDIIDSIIRMGSNISTPDNIFGYGIPTFK